MFLQVSTEKKLQGILLTPKVNSLANFLLVFAVKVVIQTVRIVAGLITLTVIEDTPTARVCTTSPGVRC